MEHVVVGGPLWEGVRPFTCGLLQRQSSETMANSSLPRAASLLHVVWCWVTLRALSQVLWTAWFSQLPPSFRMVCFWVMSDSTETSRQSVKFPWFSPSDAKCSALFPPLSNAFGGHLSAWTFATPPCTNEGALWSRWEYAWPTSHKIYLDN
jgi:hypothetical protein